MSYKHCIINFADNSAWYPKGQLRLRQSLISNGYQGDTLLFNSYSELKCKTHQLVPYGFKTHACIKARDLGYDVILYIDASIWAIKNPMPCILYIYKNGHLLLLSGHNLGRWCNLFTLKKFGITRLYASSIIMTHGGFLGLNLRNKTSMLFLDKWHKYSVLELTFKGSWSDHRHDMTVASYLKHKLNMLHIKPKFMNYYYNDMSKVGKLACFLAQGM